MPARDRSAVKAAEAGHVFAPGSDLRLTFADQQRPLQFKARVAWSEPGRLGLDLPAGWWRLRPEAGGRQSVRLARFYLGGLYSQEAVILEEHPRESPSLVLELTGALQRSQRRQFFRVPLALTVHFQTAQLPDGTVQDGPAAEVEDLSAGGAGLWVPEFLPPGCRLTLAQAPRLPGGLEAAWPREWEVVWCRTRRARGYRIGASFVFAGPREQESLARLVNHLQLKRRTARYHVPAGDTWAA